MQTFINKDLKKNWTTNTYLFVLIACLFVCSFTQAQTNYNTLFIKGFSNNNLEVLDWGGKGSPIIFLSGLGNTPHIFEDFASKFTTQYHVYGITRRGFGKSDRVTTGFSTDTLLLDILKVMDKLSLKKIILIGHSIAGDEISSFARQYPDKIIAAVYLDAALDHLDLTVLGKQPQTPPPPDNFKPTLKNIDEDYFNSHGFYFPHGELNALGKFDSSGLFKEDTTVPYSMNKVIESVKQITYKNTKCPTLAIYNYAPTVQERFRAYALFDSANKIVAEESLQRWNKYYETELERYKKECTNCKFVEMRDAHHQIFLIKPKETEMAIRKFLKQL